jgi:glutamyl-tRNA reductase
MGNGVIDLLIVGVSHKTAPVAVREKLAVEPDAMDRALAELTALPGVREAAMLSTCNRVELYLATEDGDSAGRAIAEVLAKRAEVGAGDLTAHLYHRRDADAVHHLFRVASSLDSLVVGEPQILGQTKQAHETAVRHGTVGSVLGACFEGAFRVARRVRRETEIAKNPVSVSSVAVELARQVVGDFAGRSVLVVGAGKMSELAARTLRSAGAALTVINRTRARAEELAGRYGAAVADWNDLAAALTAADIVIASTGAQRPVLTLELLEGVRRARRGRPLVLLDIAVPRDVDPAAGKLRDVYLFDIDALQEVATEHRQERQNEAAEAEAIVKEELARFLRAWRARQLGPIVTAFRKHVLDLAQAEATRLAATHPGLGENEKRWFFELADSIAKKLLHQPQMALRNDDEEGTPLVLAVQRLFKLDAAPSPADAQEGRAEEGSADRSERGARGTPSEQSERMSPDQTTGFADRSERGARGTPSEQSERLSPDQKKVAGS